MNVTSFHTGGVCSYAIAKSHNATSCTIFGAEVNKLLRNTECELRKDFWLWEGALTDSVRDHLFCMFGKYSEKLSFLTPWYVCVSEGLKY